MLQSAYVLANSGADTAENEPDFAKICKILLTDRVASPGSIVTAGKPGKKTKTSFLQYEVCTLGGQEGDIGVLPPLGIWDPLGLIETKDMRRWVIIYVFSNSELELRTDFF